MIPFGKIGGAVVLAAAVILILGVFGIDLPGAKK
jgi:hypothetical protein